MILRDYWFCWILSVAFELAEYSLQHQLANFAECWWDHVRTFPVSLFDGYILNILRLVVDLGRIDM